MTDAEAFSAWVSQLPFTPRTERCAMCGAIAEGCWSPVCDDGVWLPPTCPACAQLRQQAIRRRRYDETLPRRFMWADSVREGLACPGGRWVMTAWVASLCQPLVGAQSVTLVGPRGSGKTSALCAMARTSPWDGRGVCFVTAEVIGATMAEHPLGRGEHPDVRRWRRCDLLLIDDLGREPQSAIAGQAVVALVASRHDDMRATWVTTGLTADQIGARYGGGMMRRVYEDASVVRMWT